MLDTNSARAMINISHFKEEDKHECDDHDDRRCRAGTHSPDNNRTPTIFRQLDDKEEDEDDDSGLVNEIKRKTKKGMINIVTKSVASLAPLRGLSHTTPDAVLSRILNSVQSHLADFKECSELCLGTQC